jgi:hypothetical protein
MPESPRALFAAAVELLDVLPHVGPADLTQDDIELLRRLIHALQALLRLANTF